MIIGMEEENGILKLDKSSIARLNYELKMAQLEDKRARMTEEIKAKKLELRDLNDSNLWNGSKGSGSSNCYRVEARCSVGCGPKIIGGDNEWTGGLKLTDTEWTPISFPKSDIGVPASPFPHEQYAQHGYLSYQAAQALRWWWIANQGGLNFVSTRLVKYEFNYNYEANPIEACCVIDSEQREDVMPDWGKKKEVAKQPAPIVQTEPEVIS